jgi:hypothetical protein
VGAIVRDGNPVLYAAQKIVALRVARIVKVKFALRAASSRPSSQLRNLHNNQGFAAFNNPRAALFSRGIKYIRFETARATGYSAGTHNRLRMSLMKAHRRVARTVTGNTVLQANGLIALVANACGETRGRFPAAY